MDERIMTNVLIDKLFSRVTTLEQAVLRFDAILADEPTPHLPGIWYDWSGGECPVVPETDTELELRGGDVFHALAGTVYWDHRAGLPWSDIVRFRIVPETAEKPTSPTPAEVVDALLATERVLWCAECKGVAIPEAAHLVAAVRMLVQCPWSSETNAIARAVRAMGHE